MVSCHTLSTHKGSRAREQMQEGFVHLQFHSVHGYFEAIRSKPTYSVAGAFSNTQIHHWKHLLCLRVEFLPVPRRLAILSTGQCGRDCSASRLRTLRASYVPWKLTASWLQRREREYFWPGTTTSHARALHSNTASRLLLWIKGGACKKQTTKYKINAMA